MSKRSKIEQRDRNIRILQGIAADRGFPIQKFSDTHYRIFGVSIVDYWPTTSRCLVTGSSERSQILEPAEVIALAAHAKLPDGAWEHLRSIQ